MLYSLMTKNYKAQELLPEAQTESSEKPAQKLSAGIIASIVIFTLVGIAVVVVFTILQGKFDVSGMESALPEVSAALFSFIGWVLGFDFGFCRHNIHFLNTNLCVHNIHFLFI